MLDRMKLLSKNVAFILAMTAGAAVAQDFSYGERLFRENCSACHGAQGAGDGSVAVLFAAQPKNLQLLAKENNGQFPFSEVYQSIKGSKEISAHGIEMPVWGTVFMEDAQPMTFHPGVDAEAIVQGRILGLVYYLQSIQQ